MPPKFKRNLSHEDLLHADEVEKEGLLMPESGEEDDDFFLNGPAPRTKSVRFTDDKFKKVRVQIQEVTDVMRDNVGKLLDRGEHLEDLHDKSENLVSTSDSFRTSSNRLRKKMWWQQTKTKLAVIVVLTIILLLIFVPIILKYS